MTPKEKEIARKFNDEVAGLGLKIVLTKTSGEQSVLMENFCDEFSEAAPSVTIKKEKADDDSELPAIAIKNRLIYRAVPEGRELEPFLEAVKIAGGGAEDKLAGFKERLSGLAMAASFQIFVSPQCPFCPLTVATLAPLALAAELVRVSVIDAFLFPDLAAARGVRSVPMTFLDESFSWTGAVNLDEIVDIVKNRDASQLGTESLKNMIHEGMAAKVAEMMDGEGKVFPSFVELLTNEKWTVRLGAMVTAEELAARNRRVAAGLAKLVWDRLRAASEPVQGDLLYVIGETGDEDVAASLVSIREGDFGDEVKEAAREALERIRERRGS